MEWFCGWYLKLLIVFFCINRASLFLLLFLFLFGIFFVISCLQMITWSIVVLSLSLVVIFVVLLLLKLHKTSLLNEPLQNIPRPGLAHLSRATLLLIWSLSLFISCKDPDTLKPRLKYKLLSLVLWKLYGQPRTRSTSMIIHDPMTKLKALFVLRSIGLRIVVLVVWIPNCKSLVFLKSFGVNLHPMKVVSYDPAFWLPIPCHWFC